MSQIKNTRPVDARRAVMTKEEEAALRASFAQSPCESCGINDNTTVGCHLNYGDYSGTGFKARGMIVGLCARCHDLLDRRVIDERARTKVLERLCQTLARYRAMMRKERDSDAVY